MNDYKDTLPFILFFSTVQQFLTFICCKKLETSNIPPWFYDYYYSSHVALQKIKANFSLFKGKWWGRRIENFKLFKAIFSLLLLNESKTVINNINVR